MTACLLAFHRSKYKSQNLIYFLLSDCISVLLLPRLHYFLFSPQEDSQEILIFSRPYHRIDSQLFATKAIERKRNAHHPYKHGRATSSLDRDEPNLQQVLLQTLHPPPPKPLLLHRHGQQRTSLTPLPPPSILHLTPLPRPPPQ